MTVTGSGNARSATTSISSFSAAASSSPSTISAMRGRMPSTAFGVNAFDTMRRSRVWSGGSAKSIALVMIPKRSPKPIDSTSCTMFSHPSWWDWLLDSRASRRTLKQSAWRVTSRPPYTVGTRRPISRYCAYSGYGSARTAGSLSASAMLT
jgi:hypothetical protein